MENITKLLLTREYRSRSAYRLNFKIVRNLVCHKSAKFIRVWEKHTTQPVAYEYGKLYFENMRTCMCLYGHNGYPQLLYKLPSCGSHQKIEDCIIAIYPQERLLLENKGYRGCIIALTANKHLIRYDIDTGEVLEDIFISNRYKFRNLSWDSGGYTFVLRSTHEKNSHIHRTANGGTSLLMVLGVFSVFPMKCIAMLEVTKTVFGRDITDAMISQGILIVMHQGGLVRFYSFEHILQKGKQFDIEIGRQSPVECHDGEKMGYLPYGLPFNVKISELPPVLFEVKCSEHKLCIGGVPWHYIITPNGYHGMFNVHTLHNQKFIENGNLDMGTISVEPEKCFFHADDSGRILHIGAKEVRVLGIREKSIASESHEASHKVVQEFSIKPICGSNQQSQQDNDEITYTSSGRVVKKKKYTESVDILGESSDECIQTVDYEEDMDLLVVTSVHQDGDQYQGKIHFHDNYTGEVLQEVVLKEPWKEFCDHVVSVDLDTIVHIVKGPMRRFDVYIYRLDRTGEQENTQKTKTRKGRRSRTSVEEVDSDLVEQFTSVRSRRRNTRSMSSIR